MANGTRSPRTILADLQAMGILSPNPWLQALYGLEMPGITAPPEPGITAPQGPGITAPPGPGITAAPTEAVVGGRAAPTPAIRVAGTPAVAPASPPPVASAGVPITSTPRAAPRSPDPLEQAMVETQTFLDGGGVGPGPGEGGPMGGENLMANAPGTAFQVGEMARTIGDILGFVPKVGTGASIAGRIIQGATRQGFNQAMQAVPGEPTPSGETAAPGPTAAELAAQIAPGPVVLQMPTLASEATFDGMTAAAGDITGKGASPAGWEGVGGEVGFGGDGGGGSGGK